MSSGLSIGWIGLYGSRVGERRTINLSIIARALVLCTRCATQLGVVAFGIHGEVEAVHIILNNASLRIEGVYNDELQAEIFEQIERTLRIRFICPRKSLIDDDQAERIGFRFSVEHSVL